LLDNQTPITITENKTGLVYSIKIPSSALNAKWVLLYWNAEAKAGQGDWIELPACPFKSPVSLNKDNAADERVFLSCTLSTDHKRITFITNFPGLFVLAAK
jgi:hypothetical protein